MNDTPIRVLQIMGIVESGGVESVIINYYRNIDKTKVQFDFVIHKGSNKNYIEEVKGMGAKVYEVTPYTKNIIKFTYEIYKVVKEGNYQIVHSNMNSLSGFSLMASFIAGARVRILHNHTTDSEAEGLRTKVKRLLRPFARIFANRYWACSKLAAEWMYGAEAIKRNEVTIINNAIDLEKFAFNKTKRYKLRKELGLENKFVIGHVGRFVKAKNHNFLIDVFSEVVKQKDNSILLLIGEGELLENMIKKVEQLNLSDKVMFLGVRSDVADLYNVMDLFVLPSLYEGLPVVGVEVQANGLFLICSNNITCEIALTKNVEFLSLDRIEKWVNKIDGLSNRDYSLGSLSKFDIKNESIKLAVAYLSYF